MTGIYECMRVYIYIYIYIVFGVFIQPLSLLRLKEKYVSFTREEKLFRTRNDYTRRRKKVPSRAQTVQQMGRVYRHTLLHGTRKIANITFSNY